MTYRLGIDLGGTSAKMAVVNSKNQIMREGSVQTSDNPSPSKLVQQLARVGKLLMKGYSVKNVGVGVAGDIDFDNGIIRFSPNLHWKRVPLKKLMIKAFHRQVVVDNDANVTAWGIYKTQAPPKTKHVIVVTLGTGVGGGIILDGKLYRGATGTAGEIGHLIMKEDGRKCNCGDAGCLETYSGGFHVTKAVRKDLEKGQKSRLRTLFDRDPDQISPYAISQAAKQGDRYALGVWNGIGHHLGLALGNLIYVFNPQMIFIAGGVAQAGSLILKPLWGTLKKRSFPVPIHAVKIRIAKNAAHMGVIGASLL
ncbi:hypothetical protein BVX98_04410 [bacterium F11]|nr:hypothetical protein BVX98_04410 [bacterium F11]